MPNSTVNPSVTNPVNTPINPNNSGMPQPQYPIGNTVNKSNKNLLYGLIGGLVLVIFLLLIGFILVLSNKNNNTSTSSSSLTTTTTVVSTSSSVMSTTSSPYTSSVPITTSTSSNSNVSGLPSGFPMNFPVIPGQVDFKNDNITTDSRKNSSFTVDESSKTLTFEDIYNYCTKYAIANNLTTIDQDKKGSSYHSFIAENSDRSKYFQCDATSAVSRPYTASASMILTMRSNN